jgi:hypothetical protein
MNLKLEAIVVPVCYASTGARSVFSPVALWPNCGATAETLQPALFQRHSRMNVPALASARRPGSRCAFHRCHA